MLGIGQNADLGGTNKENLDFKFHLCDLYVYLYDSA